MPTARNRYPSPSLHNIDLLRATPGNSEVHGAHSYSRQVVRVLRISGPTKRPLLVNSVSESYRRQGFRMPKQLHYNAAEHIPAHTSQDPYLRPCFSFRDRLKRFAWSLCWSLLYRLSPRPFHAWRSMLLRAFGAQIGPNCHFYPSSKVWAPWNLFCADQVAVGDNAEIYNPAPMYFGSHAIISQGAYLCGATHDCDNPAFPLLAYSSSIGAYAWICARAIVSPGTNAGEGSVLGLASVATRDLEPWTIYAGVPATRIRERRYARSISPLEMQGRNVGGDTVR